MTVVSSADTPDEMNTYHDASVYEEALEPDDDFRRAISGEEFKTRALEIVERVHERFSQR